MSDRFYNSINNAINWGQPEYEQEQVDLEPYLDCIARDSWNGENEVHGNHYNAVNNNNNFVPNNNYATPQVVEQEGFNFRQREYDQSRVLGDNLAAIYAGQLTPASSQGSQHDGSESWPSQASGFGAPASPTYSLSLPRTSQSSQESLGSYPRYMGDPNTVLGEEDNNLIPSGFQDFTTSELNLFQRSSSGQTDSQESTGSQPEVKRSRWDQ